MTGRARRRIAICAGLAPAVLVLTALFVGPLLIALAQSLGHAPIYRITEFPSFRYYARILASSRFRVSLAYTFYYATVPTVVSTIVGASLALALRRPMKGSRLLSFFFRLPVVVPYLVGAGLVVTLFANGGLIARALYAVDAIDSTGDFPRILFSSGGWGIMLAYLFKQVPFTFVIVSSALAGEDAGLEQVARTLGASPLRALRHVVIPRTIPAIISSSLLVFAFNFQTYEIPYLLGATFPNTVPVEALRIFNLVDVRRRPEAMAYLIVITLVSGIVMYLYLRTYRMWERSKGRV